MPGVIVWEPDLPSQKFQANASSLMSKAMQSKTSENNSIYSTFRVRRPYDKIDFKDEKFAVLSVVDMTNRAIPLMSPMGSTQINGEVTTYGVDEYTDFVLKTVQEQRAEKSQIVETFGDYYVFFYGEQPRVVTFSGVLLNTLDFNWRYQFWYNYENFFRGTKLVQMNARAYIAWDTIVIEGYPLSANASEDADNPNSIPFTMQMLVTNYYDYSDKASGKTVAPKGVDYDAKAAWLTNNYEDYIWEEDPNNITQHQLTSADQGAAGYENQLLFAKEGIGKQERLLQAQDTQKIKNLIFQNNLKLQTNVRWQLSRVIGGVRDAVAMGVEMMKIQAAYGVMHNVISQAGGVVDDLAAQASMGTRAFGMFASRAFPPIINAANIATDPYGLTRALAGMDMPTVETLGASPANTASYYQNRISSVADVAFASANRATGGKLGGFVGQAKNQAQSFMNQGAKVLEKIENGIGVKLNIGEQYSQYPYIQTDGIPGYEDIFSDWDMTKAQEAAAALKQTLRETFGDVDNALQEGLEGFKEEIDPYVANAQQQMNKLKNAMSDIDPESIVDTYQGVSSRFRKSAKEILELVRQAQAQAHERIRSIQDTAGIRGVDDGVIEPVV